MRGVSGLPEDFELLEEDEQILAFTLDNRYDLKSFVEEGKSYVYHGGQAALKILVTEAFSAGDMYVNGRWQHWPGAFHGAKGGAC